MVFKSILVTLFAIFAVAATVLSMRPEYVGTRKGYEDENYIPSTTCLNCHEDHYKSWARTYHSRMTQDAKPESVQGDFEKNNTFEYLGYRARMEKRSDGTFWMHIVSPDREAKSIQIVRTVGSRRIEQYVTKEAGQYTRLPIAYDLMNKRWMSLNGSFFHPDSDNFNQHKTQWDSNCVFCHNVKAQPNMNLQSRTFKTEVAELGIACGACHGQGAEHIKEAQSPLTRYTWRTSHDEKTNIVHPEKISSERSLMLCGHCHGQRVPVPDERIVSIMTKGDPFNAGEDLSQYYKPVTKDTVITVRNPRTNQIEREVSFASRFWANGSPRLTAYEYQGLLRSKCFTHGDPKNRINCITCHSMHEGDPKGMIKEENRTDIACLKCHQEFSAKEALTNHTKHSFDSTGSRCYNCHMPRVVYGVMSIHPTHDITVPEPQLTVTKSVPNACNQCHLDKSVNWSIAESKRLWADRYVNSQTSSDEQFNQPEGVRAMFTGDAVMRSVAVEAMSGGGPAKPDAKWASPFLLEAFNDNYPIVRYFAANGLNSYFSSLLKPDYLGNEYARRQSINQWWNLFDEATQRHARELAESLRKKRIDVDIEVGE